MKIYSRHMSVATVTAITSQGIVLTVKHFYIGDPVLIENRHPVYKWMTDKKLDIFIGRCNLAMKTTFRTTEPRIGEILYTPKRVAVKVLNADDEGRYRVNTIFLKTESGTPLYDEYGRVTAYVTHVDYIRPIAKIIPILSSIHKKMEVEPNY